MSKYLVYIPLDVYSTDHLGQRGERLSTVRKGFTVEAETPEEAGEIAGAQFAFVTNFAQPTMAKLATVLRRNMCLSPADEEAMRKIAGETT